MPSRLVPFLLALVIVAPGLASCKRMPATAPAASPSYDPQVYGTLERLNPRGQAIVYWYHQNGVQEETLLEMIDQFNVENEWNITVIAEYAGSPDTIYQKVVARSGSAALPNIVAAEPHRAIAYASQGLAVELGPYTESRRWGYRWSERADFLRAPLDASARPSSEVYYGWPFYVSMEVLYYNKDWLMELGYTAPPATWNDFREMACAASDPEAGTYGYGLSVDPATFADMLFNRGGQILDVDSGVYAFGADQGLTTLTYIQELLRDGCAVLEREPSGDRADFGKRKVLFTIDSASALPDYRRAVTGGGGFDWSVAPLPTTRGTPRVYMHGPIFLVLRTTPAQQLAAWLFIKWFTEPDQQARWARALSYFPVRASTADLLQDHFAQSPPYQTAFGLLGYEVAMEPSVAGYDVCREAIREMLTAVVNGGDAAAQLSGAVEKCNASLSD